MNVYRIYHLLIYVHFQLISRCTSLTYVLLVSMFCYSPPFLFLCFIQKGGEDFLLMFTPYWSFCFWQKGGENLFLYFYPFVDDWQKGGEEFEVYMHVFLACFPCFIIKGGEEFMLMHICFVLQIGEKEFDLFYTC